MKPLLIRLLFVLAIPVIIAMILIAYVVFLVILTPLEYLYYSLRWIATGRHFPEQIIIFDVCDYIEERTEQYRNT